MLEKLLNDWNGTVDINDKHYDSVEACKSVFKTLSSDTHIFLRTKSKNANKAQINVLEDKLQYRVTVKKYMTEKSSPGFDFMAKWNNDNPMPLRTMTGTVEKETKGMVYMKLHGQAEPVVKCMRCGRTLTHPVSKLYGIGPECMSKLGFVCNIDEVETIKQKLVNVTWEGWIVKSAIIEREEIEND